MNSLPPLRTVRDSINSTSSVTQPTPPKPLPELGHAQPARPIMSVDAPGLPKPARDFLGELVSAQLLSPSVIPEFVQKVSSRAAQLTNRERTADALVGLGFVRAFVLSRYMNNQVHGLVFGPYRVLDRLGSGSLGVVFLGEHIRLGRKVAIKTIPVDDTLPPDIVARFEQEARVLASLDNPHIIKIYDEGILPAGGPGFPEMRYLALEYASGGDLENYIYAHGQQSIEQVCEWGWQIAAALRVCHAAGLVHRDLKPSNLLLTEDKRIKIVDFGLVRDFASVQTPSRILLGSLEFLAPEQVVEPATVGPAADIYSLGATLFWLFTGQLPYPQTTKQSEALDNIRSKLPMRARAARPNLPRDLDTLLAKMLARNPAERPSLSDIQSILRQQATEYSNNLLQRLTQPSEDFHTQQIRQLEDELTATKKQLQQAQLCFSNTIAAMAAACPGETVQHQQRVARTVRLLAPYLATKPNWPMMADPRIVDDYARAIAAHDFGVVTLGLGAERLEAHTKEGDDILAKGTLEAGSGMPQLRLIRSVVRHHHEAWNGTGYPDQLQGEHIPAIARLAAVVIAYDDARRGADGQPRLSHADALQMIQSRAGSQFDPVVVEALIAIDVKLDQHFWEVLEPGMEPLLPKQESTPAIRAKVPLNRWGNRDRTA